MADRRIGIILHGATGRMGVNQHLRNLLAIRDDGGLKLKNGDRLIPDPLLAGRNAEKLKKIADDHGLKRWTTDLDAALANRDDAIFFDCAATGPRAGLAKRAIAAGKHIYIEKPTAPTLDEAMELAHLATRAGLKNGVIQDKLFLPGLQKLKQVKDSGFFGRIVTVRLDFGYWIFDGETQPAQRPSWNYRRADGGGLVLDMYAHWRYIIDRIVAPITRVSCLTKTHVPMRRDENGVPYKVDVEDAAYAIMELDGGIVATVTSNWCTRVRRDDLMTLQIDGTLGSAVAGLHHCRTQSLDNTPKPHWNADAPQTMDFFSQWQETPAQGPYAPPFRSCWEGYLRHVGEDAPFIPTLLEGAKAVQLAEVAYRSSAEQRWIDVPTLRL